MVTGSRREIDAVPIVRSADHRHAVDRGQHVTVADHRARERGRRSGGQVGELAADRAQVATGGGEPDRIAGIREHDHRGRRDQRPIGRGRVPLAAFVPQRLDAPAERQHRLRLCELRVDHPCRPNDAAAGKPVPAVRHRLAAARGKCVAIKELRRTRADTRTW